MGKKWLYALLLGLIIAVAWYTLSQVGIEGELPDKTTRLNLSYQAEKEYAPELAVMILGVETTNQDLNEAFAENNQKMDRITKELEELDNLSLNTLNFQVRPRYRQEDEKEVLYFSVVNQIEVKTDNLAGIGLIIQKAVAAGANQVLSIRYTLKDLKEAREEVTMEALQGIRKKAEFVADELGKEGIRMVSINVNDRFFESNFSKLRVEGAGMAVPEAVIPPILPQKIRVTVNVNASFSLY